jgi:hypothetical protein
MKAKDVTAFAETITTTIKHPLENRTAPLEQRIRTLETRVRELEQRPAITFRGVFEAGKSYQPGDACTHGGGLWICRATTTGPPNQDFVAWQLAVKSRSITG